MTYGAVLHIIPHDVDDVGRLAKFLAQLGEFFVEILVLSVPPFTVLSLEYWKLGVVNDITGKGGAAGHHQSGHRE